MTKLIKQIVAALMAAIGVFTLGSLSGRKSEKLTQLKKTVKNAQKAKWRQSARDGDNIDLVRKRLRGQRRG